MKNRNNLTITVVIIAVFLTDIITGSKFFTDYIGNGSETDNVLNAEVNQPANSDEIVFDYPYITFDKLESYKDYEFYT